MIDNRSAYNSNVYDANIVSTLPYYREYHNQIIDLVRTTGLKDICWLDTGCTQDRCTKLLQSIEG